MAVLNLAEAYLALEEIQQAEYYARQVINAEDQATLPDGLRVIALIKAHQQQFQEAATLIDDAIHVARQNEDRYLETYVWRNAGTVYRMQGKTDAAVAGFDQAIQLFDKLGLPNEITRTLAVREETLEG